MSKTISAVRFSVTITLVLLSPIGVLLYFALAYESVAAMTILGVIASIGLILLGSAITLIGQHAHSRLNASQMALNMKENSELIKAYSSAVHAAVGGRKTAPTVQRQVEGNQSPALIIDNDAFSELDVQSEAQWS